MKVTKPLVWVTDNTDYQKKHRLWGQIDLRVKHRSALSSCDIHWSTCCLSKPSVEWG